MSVLGIDLGTSTSVFCSLVGGNVEVLKDDDGEDVIPTVVAFAPTGKVSIGKAARKRVLIDPQNTLYSMKRMLGRPWHDPDVASFRKHYPFEVERGPSGPVFVTRAGKLSATDVVTRFLAHARKFPSLMAQNHARVVVAVPELAGESQRKATLEAAIEAGFAEVDLVSEPVSAALAFLHRESKQGVYLVFDLGGGTFDAAVVRWNGLRPAVLAASGDSYLGGDDVDRELTQWAATRILHEHRWDVRSSPASYEVLRFLCEQAKVRLSMSDSTSLGLGSVDKVLDQRALTIERKHLDPIYDTLLRRAVLVADSAIAQAGIPIEDFAGVALVGGSTYSPFVRERVAAYFHRPVLTALPPDRVVAMGAALLAGIRARAL